MRFVFTNVTGLAIASAIAAAAVVWLVLPQPAEADDPAPAAAPTFVGSGECKKCHFKQFKSWKETSMAKAFATLKPGEAKEAKVKAGLDPAKDYTTDEKCLACHTTGYGQPGGYDKAAPDAARVLREGVGCESCHGAGSLYNDYMKKHEKTGYVQAEAEKLGLKKPDEKTCTACHHGGPDGSPTMAADAKFDFEKASKDEKAMHVHPPKKK